MVKIIADPGSCHLGERERAVELIRIAAESGADAIKFQLFQNKPPNIDLPVEWLPWLKDAAYDAGIQFFCSVWGYDSLHALERAGVKEVKFAFSQREESSIITYAVRNFDRVYVSCDVMTAFGPYADRLTRLYCVPLYPVPYVLDFEGIFPRFDGFSSHCLGISQDLDAIAAGAKIIEKHFRYGDGNDTCVPDGRFALSPKELYKLCKLGKDWV